MSRQHNPIRGILSDAKINWDQRIEGVLSSPDLLAGQEGRYNLTQGFPVTTSKIQSLSSVGGQLIAETSNSRYIIQGDLKC